jgi:hypothetical protein
MTSTPERLRVRGGVVAVVIATLAVMHGCGLERPPDPPPFDCAAIDRAEERFPDECGEPVDAGPEEDAGVAADAGPSDDAG